jgi:hypothetical protein
MKKRLASVLLASALFPALVHAAPAAGWDTTLRTFDDAYWSAYNRCDLKALSAMNTDDLEFFHDLGGVLHGKAQFDQAVAHNICGNPAVHVRREAIPGTVYVFPMLENGAVYGAVIEGRHRFYNVTPGMPDVLTDQARFTSLMLFKDGSWKLARALSFDHQPAKPAPVLAEVQAAPQALGLLAGTYTAKDKMVLTVKSNGNHLLVAAGGSTFDLYPTAPNNFAMKERAITVAFTVDGAGKGQGLVVRERGAVVAEAGATRP